VPRHDEELTVDETTPTLTGDFTVAFWLDVPADRAGAAGGLARMFDPTTRTGFHLSAISAGGGYNGPGDELRLSFGIDSGTQPQWRDYGRPSPTSNYVSNSLTVFDGFLHAATTDAPTVADRAHVYRCHGERQWEDLGQLGGGTAHGVGPLVVHQGALYAGTWNIDWTRVDTEDLAPCRVYRYERPGHWEDCGQPGASRRLYSLASYRGDLYVAGDDRTVQVYSGDQTWERVGTLPSHAHPMTVYDGSLVLGTLNPASVWTFDGTTWTDLGNPLGGEEYCDQIHTLDDIDGVLHLGTWPYGKVVRRDAGAAAGGAASGASTIRPGGHRLRRPGPMTLAQMALAQMTLPRMALARLALPSPSVTVGSGAGSPASPSTRVSCSRRRGAAPVPRRRTCRHSWNGPRPAHWRHRTCSRSERSRRSPQRPR
jgi:hypothetical protein